MSDDCSDPRITYHLNHASRFEYTLDRVRRDLKPGSLIADIGCHRLDFAKKLREANYEVVGFDVPEFLNMDSVQRRARELGVRLVSIEDLSKGRFGEEAGRDQFDAIIFAEIIEHIAFNPLQMWRVLFDMLRPEGYLIVTTPNSMSLVGTYFGLRRLLTRTGQGISVSQIFSTVTYGHHWKEYSRPELLEYFTRLGVPPENIAVDYVRYKAQEATRSTGLRSVVKSMLMSVPALKPDLFCTIRMGRAKSRVPDSPEYLG